MNVKLYRITRKTLIKLETNLAEFRKKIEERQMEIATEALERLRESIRNHEDGYVLRDDQVN